MEEENRDKVEILGELQFSAHSVIAVAVSGSKKSKHVVKWALEKFIPEGQIYFKLLHIHPVINRIPTPMGNFIPISQVRDDIAAAYRTEIEWQVTEKLRPHKRMCDQRKVEVEVIQIESDDVAAAISLHVRKHRIDKLVIGSSSRSIFSRARTLSSRISECCPIFCTVYAVSKGKLSSLRPSNSEASSETSCSTDNSSSRIWNSQTDLTGHSSMGSRAHYRSSSLPAQRFQALSTLNQTLAHKRMPSNGLVNNINSFPDIAETSSSDSNDISSHVSSFRSSFANNQASNSEISIDFELEKLRIELRHTRGMYAMAQGEAIDASRKLNELQKRRLDEEINLKEISLKEDEAKELAKHEKERYEAAKKEAEFVKEQAEREGAERREAEIRASRETKEKQKLENALMGSFHQYRKFTWDEIISATSSFSDDLKVGMGAYGSVYKCCFHHTIAAVKILHTEEGIRTKQFQQELEILSQIRHPHLLILLGACIDRSCLVYEFMENGSLEDILFTKNKTVPFPWFDRYRIAWEIASALVFLHNTKPNAIIHRDLKPANILLDRNNVSKIGDVGLATTVQTGSCNNTAPVGTLCYIDPEYQRTGILSPKSDVYAFGMVILQLLTGKRANGLAHKVEMAVENDRLTEVLDESGGEWPFEETKDLIVIALKCTELRRIDRPDLRDEVLPVLEKMKDVAEKARDLAVVVAPRPPSHFKCPILKEVMSDPCVAGDGYTYEREAIEAWLEVKDTSPMTNLPLPHKCLIPNYTLLSAIMEWKSGN